MSSRRFNQYHRNLVKTGNKDRYQTVHMVLWTLPSKKISPLHAHISSPGHSPPLRIPVEEAIIEVPIGEIQDLRSYRHGSSIQIKLAGVNLNSQVSANIRGHLLHAIGV